MAQGTFLFTVRNVVRTIVTAKLKFAAESARKEIVAQVVKEVAAHPISKELTNHTSPSAFFDKPVGTLFGFMGFLSGSTPVARLLAFLRGRQGFRIDLGRSNPRSISGIRTGMTGPTSEAMADAGIQLDEWSDGRSWPEVVEAGDLDGLSHFLSGRPYHKGVDADLGRSDEGVQLDTTFNRDDRIPPIPYLSPIFNKAKRTFVKLVINKMR